MSDRPKVSNIHLLNSLSAVIKHVYLPLRSNDNNLKTTLTKFVSQISHTSQ